MLTKEQWVYVAFVLCWVAALVYSAISCDGTVVRGLFWLECIK